MTRLTKAVLMYFTLNQELAKAFWKEPMCVLCFGVFLSQAMVHEGQRGMV